MSRYDELALYNGLEEDMDRLNQLPFGSEEWKRAADSIDKRYNTVLNEMKNIGENADKAARFEIERFKAEKEAELREKEAEIADRKSKREFIGKIAGIFAGIGIVAGKLIYDNSDAITDKFTLDAGSRMINSK